MKVYLGLGSNMGDRADFLRQAIAALEPHARVTNCSRVYESRAMYTEAQPNFLNVVVEGETELLPLELLECAKRIEGDLGRSPESHNQPRPIDIDIVLYGSLALSSDALTIPHPRMHERGFVLLPLAEIAPFLVHPIHRHAIIDLEADLAPAPGDVWIAEEQL